MCGGSAQLRIALLPGLRSYWVSITNLKRVRPSQRVTGLRVYKTMGKSSKRTNYIHATYEGLPERPPTSSSTEDARWSRIGLADATFVD